MSEGADASLQKLSTSFKNVQFSCTLFEVIVLALEPQCPQMHKCPKMDFELWIVADIVMFWFQWLTRESSLSEMQIFINKHSQICKLSEMAGAQIRETFSVNCKTSCQV